ncbi:hypothetical protein F0562_035245 [Nyssa sinensis]|uniref:Uncharacterized protein n=1 Tax=Nyssa sinensis TaxID=561372 RepID=A0A5J5ADT6_9ASTE|nr:hypothetical protein F0562_035245 [Nyssa sinensis]
MQRNNFLSVKLIFIALCFLGYCSGLKIDETCSSNSNCDAGLRCETCPFHAHRQLIAIWSRKRRIIHQT